jgi:hypothetical protein
MTDAAHVPPPHGASLVHALPAELSASGLIGGFAAAASVMAPASLTEASVRTVRRPASSTRPPSFAVPNPFAPPPFDALQPTSAAAQMITTHIQRVGVMFSSLTFFPQTTSDLIV